MSVSRGISVSIAMSCKRFGLGVDYPSFELIIASLPPTNPAYLEMTNCIDKLGIDIRSRASIGGLRIDNICSHNVKRL